MGGTTRACIIGTLTSMKTTMDTTPLTKAMVSSMPSHPMAPSGQTPMATAMETTWATTMIQIPQLRMNQQTSQIRASPCSGPRTKTGLDALMQTAMAGLMKAIITLQTHSNGPIQTVMAMVTTTTSISMVHNCTSINQVTHSLMMQLNGTTPTAMAGATTMRTPHGIISARQNGLACSNQFRTNRTCSRLIEPSGSIPMVIGWATTK